MEEFNPIVLNMMRWKKKYLPEFGCICNMHTQCSDNVKGYSHKPLCVHFKFSSIFSLSIKQLCIDEFLNRLATLQTWMLIYSDIQGKFNWNNVLSKPSSTTVNRFSSNVLANTSFLGPQNAHITTHIQTMAIKVQSIKIKFIRNLFSLH